MVSELLCVQEKKVAIKCLFTLYDCFSFVASIFVLKFRISGTNLYVGPFGTKFLIKGTSDLYSESKDSLHCVKASPKDEPIRQARGAYNEQM